MEWPARKPATMFQNTAQDGLFSRKCYWRHLLWTHINILYIINIFSLIVINTGVLRVCLQIDELYEAYCMQRRLRDGADKMVKAYTASPGSREARESLSEANKSFKEYTEVSVFD